MGMLGNYLASWLAFSPGKEGWGPFTPSISRHADCAGSTVPPPTVPTWIKPMFLVQAILTTILTSILGMEQVMYRSSPVGPQGSIKVIQLELPTFWAASCIRTNNNLSEKIQVFETHLASCNVDGCYNIGSVCVESSYAACHRRPHEVLGDVEVDQGGGGSLQHRADDVCGNNGLS